MAPFRSQYDPVMFPLWSDGEALLQGGHEIFTVVRFQDHNVTGKATEDVVRRITRHHSALIKDNESVAEGRLVRSMGACE